MPVSFRWIVVFSLLFAAILVPFAIWDAEITGYAERVLQAPMGKGAVFSLATALLAADIVLPVPSSIVITLSGSVVGWIAGTLAGWIGMTAGCLLGYWLGARAGTPAVRWLVGETELARARALAHQTGFGGLVVSRAVPVLAEASVLASGVTGLPFRRFLAAVLPANLGVAMVYSMVGDLAFDRGSFLLAFLASVTLPAIILLLRRAVGYR